MIINYDGWSESTRWYNVLIGAIQARFERLYVNGYKWTPFCIIKNIKLISRKELDRLSKEAMDKVK